MKTTVAPTSLPLARTRREPPRALVVMEAKQPEPPGGAPTASRAAADDDDNDRTPRPTRKRRPSKMPKQRQPSKAPPESYSDMESQASAADLQPPPAEVNLAEELDKEKQRYPGATTWAPEEERLFETLFLRQDLPLLPAHWDVDFRGVPMLDSIFHSSDEHPPVVYARSGKEFQATMALLRLIDLTSSVRTTCQSGLRHKAPALIKKAIDGFVAWAADDGGYKSLDYVPNLTVDTIDPAMPEGAITGFMQRRMRALARVQREFLRVDRDPALWDVDAPQRPRAASQARGSLLVDKFMQNAAQEQGAAGDWPSGTDELATDADATPRRAGAGTKSRPNFKSPAAGADDELAEAPSDEPASDKARLTKADETQQTAPASRPAVSYRRRPPVVYGLFVLRTSVFLLTVDAAKSDAAYVSFHVDLHFTDRHQSVWNALTVAIAVCFARDDLVSRLADFEPAPLVDDSDPDA